MSAVRRNQGSSVALPERLVLATFASSVSRTRLDPEALTGKSATGDPAAAAAPVASA